MHWFTPPKQPDLLVKYSIDVTCCVLEEDPPASLLLCLHTSAAEEMDHWSRVKRFKSLEITLHVMADNIGVLWEGKPVRLSLESTSVYFSFSRASAFCKTWGDVPVLPGRPGDGPGGRWCRTDLRPEGSAVVLLRRIWPVLCSGQVSAACFYLIKVQNIRRTTQQKRTPVQTVNVIPGALMGCLRGKIYAAASVHQKNVSVWCLTCFIHQSRWLWYQNISQWCLNGNKSFV